MTRERQHKRNDSDAARHTADVPTCSELLTESSRIYVTARSSAEQQRTSS